MSELKKYLGIDWGSKRLGLALADSETLMALPFQTAASLGEVLILIDEEEINEVIIGRPEKLSGNLDEPLTAEYLSFLAALKKSLNIPIIEFDERLSSKAADALGGSKKMRAGRDEIAAAIILQNYLDAYTGN
ncbi:MAG: Holliday junction resolvase RuvX [Patescibacteria group bacterium]